MPHRGSHRLFAFPGKHLHQQRSTLHSAGFPGASLTDHPVWEKTDAHHREVMQLCAGFGALTALVQNRQEAIHVLPALHCGWKELTFDNILAKEAFQVSASANNKQVQEVKTKSLAGETLQLLHTLGEHCTLNGEQQAAPGWKEYAKQKK